MILRDDEIQGRFKDLLKAHTRVDIATAWATRGEHLRMLAEGTKREQSRVEVRAIVGTAGNADTPGCLGGAAPNHEWRPQDHLGRDSTLPP